MEIHLEQIKNFFRRTGQYLICHYWLVTGILLLIVFLAIGFVIYKYVYVTLYQESGVSVEGVQIDQQIFQRVQDKMQEKNNFLQESLTKNYRDLFR